jgi:N-acetylglutamate synthase-like GNAT family acetyltransferase
MTEQLKYRIIKANESHREEIDRLIVEAKIGDGFEGPISNCWVAKIDGRVIGFASLDLINKRAAVFTSLVVEKPYRRHGIGSALIDARFAAARKRGIKVLALITMYYRFAFYKRRGFRTIPRAELPADIATYEQFTAKRYMKCAVMINENL